VSFSIFRDVGEDAEFVSFALAPRLADANAHRSEQE
jgi:hypothetical protein